MPGFTDLFLHFLTLEIMKNNKGPEQVHHLVLPSEKVEVFFFVFKYDCDEVTSYGTHVQVV